MLVETKPTPVSMAAFAAALRATHPDLSKAAAGVLWAQYASETGDGKHCYGHNLGNVKWTEGSGYDAQALVGTWECYPDAKADELIAKGLATLDPKPDHQKAAGKGRKAVVFTKDNPASWFRVYPDLETAMRNFVAMKQAGRYASAWPCIIAGDCDAFAEELRRKGYFTASAKSYADLLRVKHAAWMKSSAWDQTVDPHEPTHPIEIGEAHAAVDPELADFAIVHPRVDLPVPDRES